jgi:hypothetical protein
MDFFRYTKHESYASFQVSYLVPIKVLVLWYTILHRKFLNYIYIYIGGVYSSIILEPLINL